MRPYVKGSATSKAAADSASVADRQRVLDYIISRRDEGATDYELERDLNLKHQTASARRRGLEQAGLIVKTNATRKTDSGRQAGVYVCKTIANGVETNSEQFRMECFARAVLDMRKSNGDYAPVKKFLTNYGKRHGEKSLDELKMYLKMENNKREVELRKQLHEESSS